MSTPQFSPNIDPALYADEHSFTQQQQPQPPYQPQSYFPTFPPIQQKSSPPPELPPPPLEVRAVDGRVASQALQKLLSLELRDVGFGSAQPLALQRLEHEVITFVEQLYQRAHEYANLANRSGPIASDLVLACDEHNLETKGLRRVAARNVRKRKRETINIHTLMPPPSPTPAPDMLPSDDEDETPVIPATLRSLPSYFPELPPKHTYLRTPASPPKKAALPSLQKKLKTAGLVQESLKNLLLATEDNSNQEDGELLGHIVNWEAGMHPRKRWKLSA